MMMHGLTNPKDIPVFSLISCPLLIYVMFLVLFRGFTPVSPSKLSHVPKHIFSLVARTLGSCVRIYAGARVFFLCLCCALYAGTSLQAGLSPKISVKYL